MLVFKKQLCYTQETISPNFEEDRVPNGDGQHDDSLLGLWHIVLKYVFTRTFLGKTYNSNPKS